VSAQQVLQQRAARGPPRVLRACALWVALALPVAGFAQAGAGEGVAATLDDAAVAALQGPVFTTQVLHGEQDYLLVTRDRGAGREARDAYVYAKEGGAWTRVAQVSSRHSRIDGSVQGDAIVLFGENGEALMQLKLKELRQSEAPEAPAAPAQ